MNKLRFGLVGCGHMGRFHAAKISELNAIEFTGCMDIDQEKSRKLAQEYRTKPFESIDSMLGEIDAVCIAVPTAAHFEVASKFLKARVAVLLEKPIASDLLSAEKLVNIAENENVLFQIGHSERFNPAFLTAQSGISDPKFIEIHRLAPFKGRGDDVAVILDLMIHDLDLILALTCSVPEKIEAAGVAVITETVDIANARLTFPGGCVANVTASRISPNQMRKLRVFQRSGYTSIDMACRKVEQYAVLKKGEIGSSEKMLFSLPDGRVIVGKILETISGDSLKLELESFVEAVLEKHRPAVCGRDGLNVLRLALEIEKLCNQYIQKI